MNKVKLFILSVFSPRLIKIRYRYMMSLIALLIFALECICLFLPIRSVLNRQIDKLQNDSAYTGPFYNVIDKYNIGLDDIINSNFKIEEIDNQKVLTSNNTNICYLNYATDVNNENKKIIVIFDLLNKKDEDIKNVYDKYLEKYPSADKEKITYASLLILVESYTSSKTLDELIDYYDALEINAIKRMSQEISYKDLYNCVGEKEDTYVMLFNKNKFYIELYIENEYSSYEHSYEVVNLDMTKVSEIKDFTKIFTTVIAKDNAESMVSAHLFRLLFTVILFPFLMTIILHLSLRRKSTLKTFKEYYNVLSIASVFPFIISFILVWILGLSSSTIYALILMLYGMFITYKVAFIKDNDNVTYIKSNDIPKIN